MEQYVTELGFIGGVIFIAFIGFVVKKYKADKKKSGSGGGTRGGTKLQ